MTHLVEQACWMEVAWTFMNEIPCSHALMNCVKIFTGAILDSRRDGVQGHASHFCFLFGRHLRMSARQISLLCLGGV